MDTIPSENILELRRLSAKLCDTNSDNYKDIIVEVKKVVETGKTEIIQNKTLKEKIKCYENMCNNITNLLQKLN
jgi:hypothetical protein